MTDNPKAAVDAVLESETKVGKHTVYPLTLGRYAMLEIARSPFVDPEAKFDTAGLIPTFYVMTRPVSELYGYDSSNADELRRKAFEWAETEQVEDAAALVECLARKFKLVNKVRPDSTDDGKKKAGPPPTDG